MPNCLSMSFPSTTLQADSPIKRTSRSPSPWGAQSRSRSKSLSRPGSKSRSRSRSLPRQRPRSRSRSRGKYEVDNPGNTLYVTGLSSRVSERDLEEHFSKEGKSWRGRPRTPTPGHYLGLKSSRDYGAYRGSVVALVVMTIRIVGLQGILYIKVTEITHPGIHPMVEDPGGRGLGHCLIPLMVARTGDMLVNLDNVFS